MAAVSPDDSTVSEPLYKEEFARYGRNGGVTAVTFYDGDADAAATHVRAKLREVVDANPWIAGRLVKKELVFPKVGSHALVEEIFSAQPDPAVHEGQDYLALNDACVKLGVKNAASLRKTQARVSKVVLVPVAEGRFALVISISHLIADGATYYAIQNMLADGAPVRALSVTRKHQTDLKSHELKAMLPADYKWVTSLTIIKAMIKGTMSKPKGRALAYYVDEAKVAEIKDAAAKAGQWVSTNDVLTSHFGIATGARLMLFTFSYRNRIADFVDTDAGNLEGTVLLDAPGYADPRCVRKAVSSGAPYHRHSLDGSPPAPLPGFCGACPMAFLSSWASLGTKDTAVENGGIALPGATLRTHIPILPITFASTPMDVAIIYRPQPGRLAVLYGAKLASHESLTAQGSPLGAAVDAVLWPLAK